MKLMAISVDDRPHNKDIESRNSSSPIKKNDIGFFKA
jgi:hypothetical protein